MVESLYQGAGVNTGGTHNAIMSSSEYLSQVPANPASATLHHRYTASWEQKAVAQSPPIRAFQDLSRSQRLYAAQGSVAAPSFTACLRLQLWNCISAEWNQLWQSDARCVSALTSHLQQASCTTMHVTMSPSSPQARRDLNNIEDGFYISPAFLDKISIHVAKNFLDLPKIKVPLILGEAPTQPCLQESHKEMWSQLMRALLAVHSHIFTGCDRVCAAREESLGGQQCETQRWSCTLAWHILIM